jgi:hypothetical protein
MQCSPGLYTRIAIAFPNNFPLETTKAKPVLHFRIGGAAVLLRECEGSAFSSIESFSTRPANSQEIVITFCSIESFYTRAADSREMRSRFAP